MHQSKHNNVVDNLPPYEPIDCGDYDHIELACVENYLVDVVTHQGTTQGRALNLCTQANGDYLIVESDGQIKQHIRVDQIKQLIVLSQPRRFEKHLFGTS